MAKITIDTLKYNYCIIIGRSYFITVLHIRLFGMPLLPLSLPLLISELWPRPWYVARQLVLRGVSCAPSLGSIFKTISMFGFFS